MSEHRQGWVALGLLGLAAVALLAVELGKGALSYGDATVADPCEGRVAFPGEGFDATLQRIVLDGLDGAACELGATREELVLSLDPALGADVRWDRPTIERAVRAGLLRAVDDAEERGSLGELEARVLREVVRRAPLDWLIQGGTSLADLLGRTFTLP
ncbi:MAG: hypothetical protein ACRDON_11720 [Gaiellaceae bacterium]